MTKTANIVERLIMTRMSIRRYLRIAYVVNPKKNKYDIEGPIVLTLPKLNKGKAFCPSSKLDSKLLKSTLQPPLKNPAIPQNAQWLSGEGAGSWFVYEFQNNLLKVIRYSPEGAIECTGLFNNKLKDSFILADSSKITYPSNCKQISLMQNNMEYVFQRKNA